MDQATLNMSCDGSRHGRRRSLLTALCSLSDPQRGSIIIYALLTMSAMLAIGLTLSGLFVAKLRSAANVRNSTIAIYAADSAVEKCLYEARQQKAAADFELATGVTVGIEGTDGDGDPTDADITDDCTVLDSGSFIFRATGIYRSVRRTLEITQ